MIKKGAQLGAPLFLGMGVATILGARAVWCENLSIFSGVLWHRPKIIWQFDYRKIKRPRPSHYLRR